MHSYASARSRNGTSYFPACGWIDDPSFTLSSNIQEEGGRYWSWLLAICPYAGEPQIYDDIETGCTTNAAGGSSGYAAWSAAGRNNVLTTIGWANYNYACPTNTNSRQAAIGAFFADQNTDWNICPSWNGTGQYGTRQGIAGHSSYRGNIGRTNSTNIRNLADTADDTVGCGGMMGVSKDPNGIGLGFHQFTDGLGKTVVAWENRITPSDTGVSGISNRSSSAGNSLANIPWTNSWGARAGVDTTAGSRLTTGTDIRFLRNPTSAHRGDLFSVLMGDGSVTSLDPTISPTVWGNLCFRADGK